MLFNTTTRQMESRLALSVKASHDGSDRMPSSTSVSK